MSVTVVITDKLFYCCCVNLFLSINNVSCIVQYLLVTVNVNAHLQNNSNVVMNTQLIFLSNVAVLSQKQLCEFLWIFLRTKVVMQTIIQIDGHYSITTET